MSSVEQVTVKWNIDEKVVVELRPWRDSANVREGFFGEPRIRLVCHRGGDTWWAEAEVPPILDPDDGLTHHLEGCGHSAQEALDALFEAISTVQKWLVRLRLCLRPELMP
jgi:hypothetical protein